jgi:hypothetical protein
LHNDAFSLENLVLAVTVLGHVHKLVHTRRVSVMMTGMTEERLTWGQESPRTWRR